MIICGSHSPKDTDELIYKIQLARENKMPFLGICLGFELQLIEFARNVLNLENANSTEIDPSTPHPIFIKLPILRVGIKKVNGNMESHWHNYAFNNLYIEKFKNYLQFVFTDDIMEIARYENFMIGTQFHPEYNSMKNNAHPLLKEFINLCRSTKDKNFQNNIEKISVNQQKEELHGIKGKKGYLNILRKL